MARQIFYVKQIQNIDSQIYIHVRCLRMEIIEVTTYNKN